MAQLAQTTSASNNGTGVRPRPMFLSPVPFYGTIIISITGCILLLCCFICCCAFMCRSKRKNNRRGIMSAPPPAMVRAEEVQPDMEDLTDGAAIEEEEYFGKLNFSIDYNLTTSELCVGVLQAQQLPAMDIGGTSDPYVKVRLLPAMKPTFETRVQNKTLFPVFNETFVFEVPYSELPKRTLAFYVFDYDRFSKDDLMGSVQIPLKDFDASQVLVDWRDIQKPAKDDQAPPPELCFSLRYVPTTCRLTVVILEAKSLPILDNGENPDTFVKLVLKKDGKRMQPKKTSVKKSTTTPYFNETFVFEVTCAEIRVIRLRLTVAAAGFFGRARSKRLGRLELGTDVEVGSSARHWCDMLGNPRHAIASWHEIEVET